MHFLSDVSYTTFGLDVADFLISKRLKDGLLYNYLHLTYKTFMSPLGLILSSMITAIWCHCA